MFDDIIKKNQAHERVYIINGKKCIVNFNKKIITLKDNFTKKEEHQLIDKVNVEFGRIFTDDWMIKKD